MLMDSYHLYESAFPQPLTLFLKSIYSHATIGQFSIVSELFEITIFFNMPPSLQKIHSKHITYTIQSVS